MEKLKKVEITYKQSELDLYKDAREHSSPAAYYKDCQRQCMKLRNKPQPDKEKVSMITDDFCQI